MCDAPRSPSISYGSTAAETQAGSLPLPPSAISRAGSAASVHDDDSQVAGAIPSLSFLFLFCFELLPHPSFPPAVPSNAAAAHAFFHELFTRWHESSNGAARSGSYSLFFQRRRGAGARRYLHIRKIQVRTRCVPLICESSPLSSCSLLLTFFQRCYCCRGE